jgi:transcriptional regulator with XRE-family HTH domain
MMSSSAETVKKIRNALCMQQAEFGELLGITKQAILNYEQNKRTPKRPIVRKLKELAEKNGVEFSLDDFLGD